MQAINRPTMATPGGQSSSNLNLLFLSGTYQPSAAAMEFPFTVAGLGVSVLSLLSHATDS